MEIPINLQRIQTIIPHSPISPRHLTKKELVMGRLNYTLDPTSRNEMIDIIIDACRRMPWRNELDARYDAAVQNHEIQEE